MKNPDSIDKRPNRSDKYRYLICEVLFGDDGWSILESRHQAYYAHISDEKKEELLQLDDQLQDMLMKLVELSLTPRQYEILIMYTSGMTQMEIADKLGVNQSSITKSLNGNIDYRANKKVYGGIKNKMIRLIKKNEDIKPLMKQIHKVWEPGSVKLPFYQTFKNILGNETDFETWLNPPNLTDYERLLRGEKSSATQLTPEQLLTICRRRKKGARKRDLQSQYGVTAYRLNQILAMEQK